MHGFSAILLEQPFARVRLHALGARGLRGVLALVLLWGLVPPLGAQVLPGAAGQDPLLALMLSQPRIDVDSPVVPVASFEPPVVRPGQEAIYRLTFNALETSITLPAKLPVTPPVETRASAHGQLLVLTGTNYQPRTSFNYRLRPSEPGWVQVPQFTVTVYGKKVTVPTARLQVVDTQPPGIPAAQTLRFQVHHTNVYVGQAVSASVTLPSGTSLVLQHSSPLQLNGQGFLLDPNSLRPRMEMRGPGATSTGVPSIVYDLVLTPIASGNTAAHAQAFVGSRSFQTFTPTPGSPLPALPQYTLVDSDPVQFTVLPLPREGKLPGFAGAVGAFSADPPQLATNVLRVGDPVRMSVRIRGEGNLTRLVPPAPPRVAHWRVFPAEANATHPQIIQAQGFNIFNYTLVPLTEEATETPPIPFSCFEPNEGRYLDCTIPSVPVTILPGSAPADLAVIGKADEAGGGEREKEPTLSGLSASPGLGALSLVPLQQRFWFPLLQLAPAGAFFGLWLWDRQRRYYEAHPAVLLRRRARRALRKQWRALRKAADRRDAQEFSRAAVCALDIACSPFYPADPRALVGADVLALLPEEQREGATGNAVRELFRVTDAVRFSSVTRDLNPLLELEPELSSLLRTLDQRLGA